MTIADLHCYSYWEARSIVRKCRNPEEGKTVAYATKIRLSGDTVEIVHYWTPIVTILPEEKYIVDPHGYRSKTTLDRINRLTPYDVRIYQKQWEWYINWWFLQDVVFEDGIIVW